MAGCIMYVKKLQTWSIKKSTACCHVKKYCLQRAVLLPSLQAIQPEGALRPNARLHSPAAQKAGKS